MITFAAATLLIAGVLPGSTPTVEFGTPKVLRYLGGTQAAVSLQFDDSMKSQLKNAIPMLNKRGIRATFFVITESDQFKERRQEWEVDVPKAGHVLGNHTAHHSGARSVPAMIKEIADCSADLERVYGPKVHLVSFAIPGGCPWSFRPDQLDPVLEKYHLVLATKRNFSVDKRTDPLAFVEAAIETRSWSNVTMHGIGGEWLSTSLPKFTQLLDFIVAHRDTLWVAPDIEIYKYVQERDAARPPVLEPKGDGAFTIDLSCSPSRLAFKTDAVSDLYDEPLTLEVAVPDSWKTFTVTQADHVDKYDTMDTPTGHVARFDILPNVALATITRG